MCTINIKFKLSIKERKTKTWAYHLMSYLCQGFKDFQRYTFVTCQSWRWVQFSLWLIRIFIRRARTGSTEDHFFFCATENFKKKKKYLFYIFHKSAADWEVKSQPQMNCSISQHVHLMVFMSALLCSYSSKTPVGSELQASLDTLNNLNRVDEIRSQYLI